MKTLLRLGNRHKSEQGSAVIYVALILFVMLGMGALAIDVGYNRVVRNQLQNAADAAALAACNHFYDRDEPPNLAAPLPPDWAAADTEADSAITINGADNHPLQTGTVWVGWWDIVRPLNPDQWLSPPGTPAANPTGTNWGPAVRVTITKAGTENSGPMPTLFGKVLGVSSIDVDASATAVAASPGSVRPGAVLPVAITKNLANLAATYNSATSMAGIGSPYMYDSSLGGQWTSLQEDSQNADSTLKGLLETGNPTVLSTGDPIWIQSGVQDNLYYTQSGQQTAVDPDYRGWDVVLPIVDAVIADDVNGKPTNPFPTPIVGFIGFHVYCAGKGCPGYNNPKLILGWFTTAPVYGTGPVGSHYGPVDRCRLAR